MGGEMIKPIHGELRVHPEGYEIYISSKDGGNWHLTPFDWKGNVPTQEEFAKKLQQEWRKEIFG